MVGQSFTIRLQRKPAPAVSITDDEDGATLTVARFEQPEAEPQSPHLVTQDDEADDGP